MRQKLPALSSMLIPLLLIICTSSTLYSQTVTGTVTDRNQQPVANVTVQVKGGTTAVTTNQAGHFQIAASGTDTLVFTSVGFAMVEIAVDRKTT